MKQSLGVIMGDFQPFNNEHKALIELAKEGCKEVLILILQSGMNPDYRNPFSSEARRDMVANACPEVNILPVPDYPDEDEWAQDVISCILAFEEDPSKVSIYATTEQGQMLVDNFPYPVIALDSKLDSEDILKSIYVNERVDESQLPSSTVMAVKGFLKTDQFTWLKDEFIECSASYAKAMKLHTFDNPIEPVAHALVVYRNNVLLVKRGSTVGYGQWALPGGYIEHTESSRSAAIRELREETGIDLTELRVKELAQAVEENLDGLSTRTIGINYAYVIDAEEEFTTKVDNDEILEVQWLPFNDVLRGGTPLFFNHLTVIRRLASLIQ